MTKADVYSYIHGTHTVISTVSETGEPESALIGFGDTPNLTLVFGTNKMSRKYKNLQKNSAASFVIGFGDDGKTVQLNGKITELTAQNQDEYIELYLAKVPSARKYKDMPNQAYFIFEPTWVRFTDYAINPIQIVEMTAAELSAAT